jgi:hypothetical protein
MDESIAKLVEWIQSASPAVWAILVKQVYVSLVQDTIIFLVCVAVLVLSVRYWKKAQADDLKEYLSYS